MNRIVRPDVGVHMVSGKVHQFGSHFLLVYCCLFVVCDSNVCVMPFICCLNRNG